MSKKQKKMLIRIIVALVVFIACEIAEKLIHLNGVWDTVVKAAMFAVPYLMAGYDVLLKAIKNISKGHVFDENFLMAVATVGAYGTGEFGEAAAVMLFYQVGEWFQKYAVNRSRASITDLMNIMPEYANIEKDGQIVQVEPETVAIGDIIIVQPGEKVPLDGTVIEGETFVDTAALTGESVPRKLSVGDEVLSGVINQNGVIRVKVSKEFDDSTVSKILELVENDDDTYTKGYITDAFGTIIMHTDEENIGRSEEAYLSNKLLITLDQPLNKLNWNLHIALDKEMLNKSVSKILYNGNKVYIFSLLGLALVFYLLIQKFTRPLNKIQKAMEVTGAGKKRKKVKIEGDNEVWKLAEVYNEMLDKLLQQEQETEKSYRMSLMAIERQHQADREALETQINAHFLCNTLGTINYEAIEAGNMEEAKTLFSEATKKIDQACTKGVIVKNTAARKKSNMAKKLNAMNA